MDRTMDGWIDRQDMRDRRTAYLLIMPKKQSSV